MNKTEVYICVALCPQKGKSYSNYLCIICCAKSGYGQLQHEIQRNRKQSFKKLFCFVL